MTKQLTSLDGCFRVDAERSGIYEGEVQNEQTSDKKESETSKT